VAEGELGLYHGKAAFVTDEAPDAAETGVPEEEYVRASLEEAAGILSPREEGQLQGPAPPSGTRMVAALTPRLLENGASSGSGSNPTAAEAAVALRDAALATVRRLLLALPDEEAAAVHAVLGAPPPPSTPPEACSYWLASALALTPSQRKAAAASVSTLTRLCVCYGVLLTAAATVAERRRSREGGVGGAGEAGSEGGQPHVGSSSGSSSSSSGGGGQWDLRDESFNQVEPRDALAFFSRTGGQGGDDPDADLIERYPPGSGVANALLLALHRAFRILYRIGTSRYIQPLLILFAVAFAILQSKNRGQQWYYHS
jgi:hypothetical protein